MHDLLASISQLENLAKRNLKNIETANLQRLKEVIQLVRYGVCTCHCHYSTSVYHAAAPCCGNAKIKTTP